MTEDRKEIIENEINEIIGNRIEYEEIHKDAGSAYEHMPREGSWDYENNDEKLMVWVKEQGIDTKGLEPDVLANIALDNFNMVPGSIYGPYIDGFIAGAFPIQEHEIQIDLDQISIDVTRDEIKNCNFDLAVTYDGEWFYASTDAVWFAVITKKEMQDAINTY